VHHVVPLVVLDVLSVPILRELHEDIVLGIIKPDTTDDVPVGVLPGDSDLCSVGRDFELDWVLARLAETSIVATEIEIESREAVVVDGSERIIVAWERGSLGHASHAELTFPGFTILEAAQSEKRCLFSCFLGLRVANLIAYGNSSSDASIVVRDILTREGALTVCELQISALLARSHNPFPT